MVLAAAFFTLSMQVAPAALDCASATAQATSSFASQVCLGERQLRLGEGTPKGSAEQRGHFESAVEFYRKAEAATSVGAMKVAVLEILARLYDDQHLNEPAQAELVFRELASLNPDDMTVMFRLAKAQEDQQELDAAETTLLQAHHLRPDDPGPDKMLAQFFARRVSALSRAASEQVTAQKAPAKSEEPDKDGFIMLVVISRPHGASTTRNILPKR